MLTGAKAQEYDRLRSLGHSMECAFDMADLGASCVCQSLKVEPEKSIDSGLVEPEKKRGRPRKYQTDAAKQAAYRERHLVRLADLAGQIVALEVDK